MISLVVNTLVWGGQLALITVGFSLSYAALGFANFAHMEFVTFGAFAYVTAVGIGLPFVAAVAVAVVATGVIAVVLDLGIFRRLQEASVGAKMIASIGVALLARTLIQAVWGAEGRLLDPPVAGAVTIGGQRITLLQVVIVAIALASTVGFHLLLRHTRLGKVVRATADDMDLARVRGIDADRVVSWVWFLSGAFAGLGGILIGIETLVRPSLGVTVLLPLLAAATVGTLGSAYGAIAGSFLLALVQNSVLRIDFGALLTDTSWRVATTYKPAVALAVLVVVLAFWPRGLFARELT